MGASTSLRTGTIGHPRFGLGLGRFAPRDALEELAELLEEFGVIQVGQALASDHHDIPTCQCVLTVTKAFADDALEAIPLDSELYALLADHQTETGMFQLVFVRQQENVPAWSPCGR